MAKGTRPKTDRKGGPRYTKNVQRQMRAMDMRVKGNTYRQIGDSLNISDEAARQLVLRALDRVEKDLSETSTEVLRIELERLDVLVLKALERAETGDSKAINSYIQLATHRARLMGLDVQRVQAEVTAKWETMIADVLE